MLRIVVVVWLAATVVAAQSPSPLPAPDPSIAFEVASIKRTPPPSGGFTFPSASPQPGGRWTAQNATFVMMLRAAYAGFSLPGQVVGGPAWIDSERFEVQAKAAEGEPSGEQMTMMLRRLLAERFALEVHIERRELDVYALVLARSDGRLGPGLREAAVDCQALAAARERGEAPPEAPPAPGQRPDCGRLETIRAGVRRVLMGGAPIASVAGAIQSAAGRPVLDRTGLTGEFDVDLEFAREGGPQPAPRAAAAADPAPSVFTALQEQLGLKLESRTEIVDVLVIDQVEMPTPD
jgi:uncharacterized protein (TIGR03435 family)